MGDFFSQEINNKEMKKKNTSWDKFKKIFGIGNSLKISNFFAFGACQFKKYSYICTLILGKKYAYFRRRYYSSLLKWGEFKTI